MHSWQASWATLLAAELEAEAEVAAEVVTESFEAGAVEWTEAEMASQVLSEYSADEEEHSFLSS